LEFKNLEFKRIINKRKQKIKTKKKGKENSTWAGLHHFGPHTLTLTRSARLHLARAQRGCIGWHAGPPSPATLPRRSVRVAHPLHRPAGPAAQDRQWTPGWSAAWADLLELRGIRHWPNQSEYKTLLDLNPRLCRARRNRGKRKPNLVAVCSSRAQCRSLAVELTGESPFYVDRARVGNRAREPSLGSELLAGAASSTGLEPHRGQHQPCVGSRYDVPQSIRFTLLSLYG
jgi:hypothetical protein